MPEHLSGVAVPLGSWRAALGWASDGARQKLGEGSPCGGREGVQEQVSPRPANLAAGHAALAPLPDPCLYPNRPPVRPPPLRVAVTSRCSFLNGTGGGM